MLEALRMINEVDIVEDYTAIPAIHKYRPHIYAKGIDYRISTPDLERERKAVESYGGELVIVETPKFSSTEVIQRLNAA